MKLERTKNATRGIAFGGMLKIYQMFIPFLMRTAMIYFMGMQYLGLNSLFTSVISVLNLAELGVGNAMVFSMYKPIKEDDTDTICSLLKLYRIYYRVIGTVIAVVGLAITPFVPKLIKGTVPDNLNVYILYWLNLAATVLTYWLFAYKNSLLQAHQRTDISSIIMLITNTLQYALQLVVLLILKDYYVYVIVILLTQVVNNISTAVVASKLYPNYKPVGNLDKETVSAINGKIKDLFTGKVGSVILNSADTVVISAFLGLTVLAMYQNYYFVLTSVIGFVQIVLSSMMAGLGNSFLTDTREKNYVDFEKFSFMYQWLIGFCTCCFLLLFQPFMRLWVGEKHMFSFSAVICFCIYFYAYEFNRFFNVYKDAAGLWHEDRFRPLITSLTNLTFNLLLVKFCGVYGVLLSTVISIVFVGMPWLFHNLFSLFFDSSYAKKYLRKIIRYLLFTILACAIALGMSIVIPISNDWLRILVNLLICIIVPNTLFVLIYFKSDEFIATLILVDRMTKNKFKFAKLAEKIDHKE